MSNTEDSKMINKIYNKLLPSINRMYNNYIFLGITKVKFEQLITDIIQELYNKKTVDTEDVETYVNRIKSYLDVYVKLRLKEPENTIYILSNFINNRLSVSDNSEQNLKQLRKFSNFTAKYNFIPTPDHLIELIKTNKRIATILKYIIEENVILIEKSGIQVIDDNDRIISLLDTYCLINNIEYQKHSDETDLYNNLLEEYDTYTVDSVKAYLLEIQRPLLTAEEELELAIRKSNGDEKAKAKLIEHNLKWVVSIAKGYAGRGLDILELIQEGNIGLMTAVDRFDYTKGFRLTTYSRNWIIQSIGRALSEKSRNIRIPVYLDEQIKKYHKIKITLSQKLNREPTLEEIACIMGVSINKLKTIINSTKDTVSINMIVDEDGETEMQNFIPSEAETPEELYAKSYLLNELNTILKKCNLKERELEILLLRNGFYDGKPKTLEEVGKIFGVTRERIRQIENKALKKIRMSPHAKKLLDYVDDPKEAEKRLKGFREFYRNNISSHKSLQSKKNSDAIDHKEITSKPKEKQDMRKLTIFEHFQTLGFEKEQVLEAISTLTDKQKELINIRHGGDINNPVYTSNLTQSQRSMYSYIIKKIGIVLVQKYRTENNEDIETIISTPQKKVRMPRTRKSIYQKFTELGYTREEIQDIINNLDEKDKQTIDLMNGPDLDNPVKSPNVTPKDESRYYQVIIKKIEKRLHKKYRTIREAKNLVIEKPVLEVKPTAIVDSSKEKQVSIEKKQIEENTIQNKEKIEKEDYIKILELIKTPTFGELMTKLNTKQAVIIALRLGYVDNKYFSTESIATFLEITEEEVRETTKEIVTLYKESINNFIDEAILILSDKANVRKLRQ